MQETSSSKLQLSLGTGAFALCFAVFGTMSAMMPILSRQMHLTSVQKSIAVALPVLLGSLGRIPLGILTDQPGDIILFSSGEFRTGEEEGIEARGERGGSA